MKKFQTSNCRSRKLKNNDHSTGYSYIFQQNSPMFSTGFLRPMKYEMIKNYSHKDFSISNHKTSELIKLGLTSHFLDMEKQKVCSLDKLFKREINRSKDSLKLKGQLEQNRSMQKIFTRACLMRTQKQRTFSKFTKQKQPAIIPLNEKLVSLQKAIQERQSLKTKGYFDLKNSLKQRSHTKYAIRKKINANKTIEHESISKREIDPWEVEEDIEPIVTLKIKK